MSSYQEKANKLRRGGLEPTNPSGNVVGSSKVDAFLDGVGTLIDIFPDPRPRRIRAFFWRHAPRARSVKEAISADWDAVGQDMWAAIEAHKHEASTEEAASRLKSLAAQ